MMEMVRGFREGFKDIEEGHSRQWPRRGKDRVAYADMVRGCKVTSTRKRGGYDDVVASNEVSPEQSDLGGLKILPFLEQSLSSVAAHRHPTGFRAVERQERWARKAGQT